MFRRIWIRPRWLFAMFGSVLLLCWIISFGWSPPKTPPTTHRVLYEENLKRNGIPKKYNPRMTIETFDGLNWTFFKTGENRFAYMPHDTFMDLQVIVGGAESTRKSRLNIGMLFEKERQRENQSSLHKFHMEIGQYQMYPEDSKYVDQVLYDLATLPITKAVQKDGGTQFKLTLTFENTARALFKPMRSERHENRPTNQLYYAEFERHTSEIAAFHLDRVMGFRKAMPVTGRKIDLITDVLRLAEKSLQSTFYKSPKPDENLCVTGDCSLFCDDRHPICGKGHIMEGSFTAFYPMFEGSDVIARASPWMRSYSVKEKHREPWEKDPNFCVELQQKGHYKGSLLMELIDMSIFDFLIGNSDRHHYGQFKPFNDTFIVRYDHGRAFGRPYHDELTIAAPFLQCCMIRATTLDTLLRLHNGQQPLSTLLEKSLATDPVKPILLRSHLDAVDRRLSIILHAARHCIERHTADRVIEWNL